MMQSELIIPSWPSNFSYSTVNQDHLPYDLDLQDVFFSRISECDFSGSFASPNESSINSSNSCIPAMEDEFLDLDNWSDERQISSAMEGFENISSGEIEKICEWMNEDCNPEGNNYSSSLTMEGDHYSPSFSLESSPSTIQFPPRTSLVLPDAEMVIDPQLNLHHLMKGYGEAIGYGQEELAQVIAKPVNEKASPLGNTMERVAYNLFQSQEDQGKYLRQESSKYFIEALKVIHQSLPNGRLAHFAANRAILESIPHGALTMHIVDSDMGEGSQWPPLIESLSKKFKAVRLTSIKLDNECSNSCWNFEKTKERLQNYARQFGLELMIEEKGMSDLVNEIMRMKRSGKSREWLVFNCMVGLPHMGRRRPRNCVTEFLRVAKELTADSSGIVVLGDGEGSDSLTTCSTYGQFFDKLLRYYQAIFESLERNFPVYLAEARAAMESLFLAPCMCMESWFKDWEEMTKGSYTKAEIGLEGRRISQESLSEARQVVNGTGNLYTVKIEGTRENEMVLQWKETPLVRVSTWM